jgi:hypothetical protein
MAMDVRDREMTRSLLTPRLRRLIRSYGLLVLIALGFLLMALLVSTPETTEPVNDSLGVMGAWGVAGRFSGLRTPSTEKEMRA